MTSDASLCAPSSRSSARSSRYLRTPSRASLSHCPSSRRRSRPRRPWSRWPIHRPHSVRRCRAGSRVSSRVLVCAQYSAHAEEGLRSSPRASALRAQCSALPSAAAWGAPSCEHARCWWGARRSSRGCARCSRRRSREPRTWVRPRRRSRQRGLRSPINGNQRSSVALRGLQTRPPRSPHET